MQRFWRKQCRLNICRSSVYLVCTRLPQKPLIGLAAAPRLGVEPHAMHVALEAAVREHLQELGDMRPRVD
jgi:hypothetical protein